MKTYLSNAFSLQMQGNNDCVTQKVTRQQAFEACCKMAPGPYINKKAEKDGSDARLKMVAISVVGHADIASVLSGLLGFEVPVNRVSIALQPGDTLVVGQYVGPRLPEGCKTLPTDARIDWYMVRCYVAGNVADLQLAYADFKSSAYNYAGWSDCAAFSMAAKKHFPDFFDENAFD